MAETNRWRTGGLWLGLAVVLLVPSWMILQKERLLDEGRTILLRLAPVDPRSLIQGDYMALRYAFPDSTIVPDSLPRRGRFVIDVGPDSVAHIDRLYQGGMPLGPEEHLLGFHRQGRQVYLGAEAFFFQEGHAEYYQDAEYGELKVSDDGESILVGLRDAERRRLGPAEDEV